MRRSFTHLGRARSSVLAASLAALVLGTMARTGAAQPGARDSNAAQAVDRCTIAVPPTQATVAVEIANATDFCELFSHALADDVFHEPVLVVPGVLWHYRGAALSCRLQYRSTRERMTINNAPAACRWLEHRATGWRLESPSGYPLAA